MISKYSKVLSIAIAALFVASLSACGDDDSTGTPQGTATTDSLDPRPTGLPSWLVRVYPEDGADAAERAVEVDYGALGDRQELRVVIDGTDVTAQLDGIDRVSDGRTLFPSPGQLRYDPHDIERPLVELEPGPHTAEVRLVELDEFGANLDMIDEYSWTFRIL